MRNRYRANGGRLGGPPAAVGLLQSPWDTEPGAGSCGHQSLILLKASSPTCSGGSSGGGRLGRRLSAALWASGASVLYEEHTLGSSWVPAFQARLEQEPLCKSHWHSRNLFNLRPRNPLGADTHFVGNFVCCSLKHASKYRTEV